MTKKIKSLYDGKVLEAFEIWRESDGLSDTVRALCFDAGKWKEVLVQVTDVKTGTCMVNYVPEDVPVEFQRLAGENAEGAAAAAKPAKKARVK